MPQELPIRRVTSTPSTLGEGPLWDGERQSLLAIDVVGRRLLRSGANLSSWSTVPLAHTPGSFVRRADGGFLMAYRRSLALANSAMSDFEDIRILNVDFATEVFNDGKCDRRGRFWIGTMDREVKAPVGSLYRLDTDRSLHRMQSGFTLSNGIAWSPDDSIMYHCDSRPGTIWAHDYDIDRGTIRNRRVFVDYARRLGAPDGCTVDSEGGLWVAEVGAGQVVRFDPSGRESTRFKLPVSKPTSIALGGMTLKTLFVTSMRYRMEPEQIAVEPFAGHILAIEVDVAGIAEPHYGG